MRDSRRTVQWTRQRRKRPYPFQAADGSRCAVSPEMEAIENAEPMLSPEVAELIPAYNDLSAQRRRDMGSPLEIDGPAITTWLDVHGYTDAEYRLWFYKVIRATDRDLIADARAKHEQKGKADEPERKARRRVS